MFGAELVVILVMIALNGVFASYEIALASVSVARLEAIAKENRVGAKAALRMKRGMERSLAVVQLGVTLSGAIAAATGGAWAGRGIVPVLDKLGVSPVLIEPAAIAFVAVPLTVVTIIFGELIPKVFGLRNKEWVCLRLSSLMSWVAASVWPIVWLLEKTGYARLALERETLAARPPSPRKGRGCGTPGTEGDRGAGAHREAHRRPRGEHHRQRRAAVEPIGPRKHVAGAIHQHAQRRQHVGRSV